MKFLVTGCCGFIGSNFVKLLLKTYPDCHITNLDSLTYAGNPENLQEVQHDPRYTFLKGDICDPEIVDKAMRGADIVINFAAESFVDRSISNANPFVTTNFYGTYVLLEAARHHKVSRFVQISTDEVYGSTESGSFSETDRLEPSSPYSSSKAAGDLLALSYYITYGLPVIVCRSSNNYGPNQHPEKFIPLFITNALEDKKLPLYGDGLNVRDWLFVEDNCQAIILVARKGKPGEIYNIGSGNERSNSQVAERILSLLGKPSSLIQYVADRLGHDRRYSLVTGKIAALGWSPAYTFEQGLERTVLWYKENTQWWKKLKK